MTDNSASAADRTLKPAKTTRDAFLGGRITVVQPKSGPRAAIDALFLAAAVPAVQGMAQRILEAGTGTGVAALALCARIGDACVTGIEIQPALLEFARENARINRMEDRLNLVEADITANREALEKTGLRRESFDHMAANPPFFVRGASREAADPATARAYSAGPDALGKWVRFLATAAAPGGTLTLIHRAEALGQLLALLDGKFGGLSVYPLFPRDGVAAKRILVRGIKASRAPLRLLPGMVLHEPDGSYTAQADAVLRDAAAIDFGIK